MRRPSRRVDATELSQAIRVLLDAGAVFSLPRTEDDSLSLAAAAKRLDVKPAWFRERMHEFPNAWRLPAGALTRHGQSYNVGEWRIPIKDIEALEARQRMVKSA